MEVEGGGCITTTKTIDIFPCSLTPHMLRKLFDLRMMNDVVEFLDKTQKTVNDMKLADSR